MQTLRLWRTSGKLPSFLPWNLYLFLCFFTSPFLCETWNLSFPCFGIVKLSNRFAFISTYTYVSGAIEAALRFSTIIPSALPLSHRKHVRGGGGGGGEGVNIRPCISWSPFQIRRRGLLRQQARAQLLEKNANTCIVLSPEEKVSNRSAQIKLSTMFIF